MADTERIDTIRDKISAIVCFLTHPTQRFLRIVGCDGGGEGKSFAVSLALQQQAHGQVNVFADGPDGYGCVFPASANCTLPQKTLPQKTIIMTFDKDTKPDPDPLTHVVYFTRGTELAP